MNRPACLAVGLLVCGWVACGALAQDFSGMQPEPPSPAGAGPSIPSLPSGNAAGGPGLSVEMKNAADATGFRPQIAAFVQQQVAKIADNVPDDQRTARELLIGQCDPNSTASFLSIFASEVNTSVIALLEKTPPPPLRVRLNLAVLVESVAHTTRDASLKPTVSKLVSDPSEPIALWGIRAARALLVPVAQQNVTTPDPLIGQVVAAVKSHVKFGLLAEEAYRTLSLDGEGVTFAAVPNALTNSTQAILDEINFRISLYKTSIPDDPEAENVASSFFAVSYDKGLAAADQQKIVQSLCDLVGVVGAQSGGASRPVLEQMVNCLKVAAQSLDVITHEPMGTPLQRVMQLVAGSGGGIAQQTGQVFTELKANPQFAYLRPPPRVIPIKRPAAATQHHNSTSTPPPPTAAAAAR